jgi:hypothetical protein
MKDEVKPGMQLKEHDFFWPLAQAGMKTGRTSVPARRDALETTTFRLPQRGFYG